MAPHSKVASHDPLSRSRLVLQRPALRGRQYQDPLSRSNHIHIASLSKANKEKNQRPALEVTYDTTMAPLSKATTVTTEAVSNKTHSRGQPQHNASHSKATRHTIHSRGHIRYNHGPTLEGRKSRPTLEVKTRTTTPRSRGRQYQDPLLRSNHIHIASLSKVNKEKSQRPALEATYDTRTSFHRGEGDRTSFQRGSKLSHSPK